MADLVVDVLVVGAGPVGLTAALLLRAQGCTVALVERRDGPQRAPAAHVVNARTFEVWRQLGLDLDRLLAEAHDPADAGWVHWVTKLGGEVLGSLPFERQGDEVLAFTPTPLRNLSQHRLEPVLVDELEAVEVPVRYGHEWIGGQADGDGVVSTVRSAAGELTVASRWLFACDGASSPVRRSVGIEPVGPHRLQSFVMVHLAADLRGQAGDPPGVLFWVCDPAAGGAFVAHDLDREWVYMYPFDPAVEDADSFTPARCTDLVRAALQPPDLPFDVLAVSTWVMTAQVAERYRSGPVFLVGDSAHRFPPTGGLGLNTGVQDAHNLAWKIAAVRRGAADDRLLDTYERERRPVAQHNAEVSLTNAMKMVAVPIALGADDDAEVAAAAFRATLADDAGRAAVQAAIADQATHFDMLGLQLGYRYDLEDGEGGGVRPAGAPDREGIDPVRTYVPSSDPGGRLPHGWIRRGGRRCSTLDLVPIDAAVSIGGPDCAPGSADLVVGSDFEDPGSWWSATLGLPADAVVVVRPDQHIALRR